MNRPRRRLLVAVLCLLPLQFPPLTRAAGPGLEARWRAYLERAAGRQPADAFPFAECFRSAAAAHQVPEALLLAVARGESDFDHLAKSSANAYGLMQIQWPGTARHLGIDRRSQLLQPCTNVDAGARYLKELLARYAGNAHRALAAYNYGPGRIPLGGEIPDGAAWYSGYILRHLDYVLSRKGSAGGKSGRRPIIRFDRPYRAAAFVDQVQPLLGDVRVDWFRQPDGGFQVVLIYDSPTQLQRGRKLLSGLGFE